MSEKHRLYKHRTTHQVYSIIRYVVLGSLIFSCASACVSEENTVQVTTTTQPRVTVQTTQNNPLPPTNPTVADITDLVLVTGQSNALGAGTGYDANLDSSNDRVFAYTDSGWKVASLRQVWDQRWFPRTDPLADPSNNFSLHFGKRLAERDNRRVIGFILVTAPGERIDHWRGNGEFFNGISLKVSSAINELPSKSQLDGILWHQGESDGQDDDMYSQRLYELINNFRSESWFGFGKPFICGETATLPVNEQLRKLNWDNNIWTACIEAEGLATQGDDAHFNAESLRLIGRRYADRYYDMTR